jgi:hypothetical protein
MPGQPTLADVRNTRLVSGRRPPTTQGMFVRLALQLPQNAEDPTTPWIAAEASILERAGAPRALCA